MLVGRWIGWILAAVWLSAGWAGAAPDLRHGLLWRDSPLAATFPLVVKTPAGHDFYLRVEEADTGKAVLAAGIRGGSFFRVLVPNGRFVLDIAFGTEWRGEEARFAPGPRTGAVKIDTPLLFGVEGLSRKAGHVVTLTEEDGTFKVAVKGQAICQSQRLIYRRPLPLQAQRREDPGFPFSSRRLARSSFDFPYLETEGWSHVCD